MKLFFKKNDIFGIESIFSIKNEKNLLLRCCTNTQVAFISEENFFEILMNFSEDYVFILLNH